MNKQRLFMRLLVLFLPGLAFAQLSYSTSGGTITNTGTALMGSATVIQGCSGNSCTVGTNVGTMNFFTGPLASGSFLGGGTYNGGGFVQFLGNGIPSFAGTFSGPIAWNVTTLPNGSSYYTLFAAVTNGTYSGSMSLITLVGDARAWGASYSSQGSVIIPTGNNPGGFEFQATVAGGAGIKEPTWPQAVGATQTEGLIWKNKLGVDFDWHPLTSYAFPDTIIPSQNNAGQYMFRALVTGVSGDGIRSIPVWPQAFNTTITDGGVLWANIGIATAWAASHLYNLNDIILPAAQGNPGNIMFQVEVAGYSGPTEPGDPPFGPGWPQTPAETVTEGATWINIGYPPSIFVISSSDTTLGSVTPPPPAVPTNLQATQVGVDGTQVALTWDYGSEPVDGFVIQHTWPSAGGWFTFTTVTTASVCGPSPDPAYTLLCTFSDLNISPFEAKSYQVGAYQGSTSNISPNSAPATAYQLKKCVAPWSGFSGTGRYDCRNGSIGTSINVDFTPDTQLILHDAARTLPADPSRPRFDHFNWLSWVEHYPKCYVDLPANEKLHTWQAAPIFPQMGPTLPAPHIDPPSGGWFEYGAFQSYPQTCFDSRHQPHQCKGPSDELPFYYNEKKQWYLFSDYPLNPTFGLAGDTAGGDQNTHQTASFYDQPRLDCLPGSPPDYEGFLTYLVGVATPVGTAPPSYVVLNAFAWNTTFNSDSGGVSTTDVMPPVAGGSGGIFNVSSVNVANLPPYLRQQLLAAGAQGISAGPYIDTNAPMTAAFLSGKQGTNGWYTGPVTLALIATDIDGPSDIAETTYTLDGGSALAYSGPFTVSGDGIHSIQFGSKDLAGNVETPKTIIFKVGQTPPIVTCSASPNVLWPPNNKLVPINVSVNVADALSGPAGFTLVSITSNEPDSGQGDIQGFVTGTASRSGQLRAQRLGTGTGRVYTFTYSGSDKAGNTASCTTAVLVPHDQGH